MYAAPKGAELVARWFYKHVAPAGAKPVTPFDSIRYFEREKRTSLNVVAHLC